jgi:hypothetical protein
MNPISNPNPVYSNNQTRGSMNTAVNTCIFLVISTKKKTKLRGLGPQANYTVLATAACRRS